MHNKDDIQLIGIYTITVGCRKNPKKIVEVKNRVVKVGRALLAEQLMPNPSSTASFTHIVAGNGTVPFGDTQTTLDNETLRGAVVSQGSNDGVATCAAVFPAGTATGTYTEFGIFLEATGTTDDGVLFSRILYDIDVSASDPLFIDYRITLSN